MNNFAARPQVTSPRLYSLVQIEIREYTRRALLNYQAEHDLATYDAVIGTLLAGRSSSGLEATSGAPPRALRCPSTAAYRGGIVRCRITLGNGGSRAHSHLWWDRHGGRKSW